MSLSATQIDDLHMDLATDSDVFSDPELERLWVRTQATYNTYTEAQQLIQLRLHCIRILRANSVKLYDYQLAQQIEKRSQVFAHLKALEDDFRTDLGVDSRIAIIGALYVPPRDRTMPDGSRG